MALSVEFIYLVARLARLGSGKISMALSAEFIYLAARLARLARQWKNNCMHVNCRVHIFSGSFGSAVEKFLWR